MSKTTYTLVPNVGKNIHLVQISRLPKCIPPPDPSKRNDEQGPEWDKFLSLWSQLYAYYGTDNPGDGWKPRCNILDLFVPTGQFPNREIYSGIFYFIDLYQQLLAKPDLETWPDDKIREAIWGCVTTGRAHVWATDWRVWNDWGKV